MKYLFLFIFLFSVRLSYAEERREEFDKFIDSIAEAENQDMQRDLLDWTDDEAIEFLSNTQLTIDDIKELYENFKNTIVNPPNPDTYTEYSIENAEESLAKVEKLGLKIHNMLFAISDRDLEKYGKLLHRMRDALFIDWKHIPYAIQHNNGRDIYWYQLHAKWLENVEKEYLNFSSTFIEE